MTTRLAWDTDPAVALPHRARQPCSSPCLWNARLRCTLPCSVYRPEKCMEACRLPMQPWLPAVKPTAGKIWWSCSRCNTGVCLCNPDSLEHCSQSDARPAALAVSRPENGSGGTFCAAGRCSKRASLWRDRETKLSYCGVGPGSELRGHVRAQTCRDGNESLHRLIGSQTNDWPQSTEREQEWHDLTYLDPAGLPPSLALSP